MGEIDLKKLNVSIEYIKRMAEGKNPINNEPLDEDSILNNPNVIRCFYFIEDVLKQVKDADGKVTAKKRRRNFPIEHLSEYTYRKDLSISHFMDQINEGLNEEQYKKLSYPKVTGWLKSMGYLDVIEDIEKNEKKSIPSEKGRAIGIYTEEREGAQGRKYLAVMYNRNAQQFIIDNMENILDGLVV
ncbi:MAG: hypothetical protein IJA07_06855 [Agathobacter sp.]|nr:hypothetical protein [Agathobacter sp.]